MQIRQLQYFLSLCNTLSFTKTAKEFFVSQSAVTLQIQALEKELDSMLFKRTNRRVDLTPAGHILKEEAAAILKFMREAEFRVKTLAGMRQGSIRIGYLKGFEYAGLNKALKSFHEWLPEVQISLQQGSIPELENGLRHNKFDIVFSALFRTDYDDYEARVVGKYPMLIAVRKDHPLARNGSVSLEDLKDYPMVQTESSNEEMSTLMRFYSSADYYPNVSFVSDDIRVNLLAVEVGYGYTLLPSFMADLIPPGASLTVLPLVDRPEELTVGALWRKDSNNPMVESFFEVYLNNARA